MRVRLASIKRQLDVLVRSHDETAELAAKVFELHARRRNSRPHNEKTLRRDTL
jgi:hypothetical protein